MYMNFTMGNMENKHVLGGKMCERLLKMERWSVERISGHMVSHVEAFHEVCRVLNKVCNAQRSDWDLRLPLILWAYRTTCKKLTRQTPFRLVYGVEAIMPMEYIVPSLRIEALTGMIDHGGLEKRLA